MKLVVLENVVHRQKNCIAIRFPKDFEMIRCAKQITGCRFSATMTSWYVEENPAAVDKIIDVFKGVAQVDTSRLKSIRPSRNFRQDPQSSSAGENVIIAQKGLKPFQKQALRLVEQKLHLKGYSNNTARTYLQQFKEFLMFYHDSHPIELSETEIRNYLLYLIEKRKLSRSAQNQAINAIKFFYEKVLNQDRKVYHLERPMKEKKLPKVLSRQDVMSIFAHCENTKHRLAMMIIYAAGLRRSELLNLRVGDVDIHRLEVFVRGGKGKKDRRTVMAKSLIPLLKSYLEEYKPSFWLIEGRAGMKYSSSSLHQVLKYAATKAGIRKSVNLHMLRHSFATHMLEDGYSTRYIQELLGHESPETTEIYAQVTKLGLSKIKSPLDNIAESGTFPDQDLIS